MGSPRHVSSWRSRRTRGKRASVFNMVEVDADSIQVHHFTWDRPTCRFHPAEASSFPRHVPEPVVSAAGGDDPDARETPPES